VFRKSYFVLSTLLLSTTGCATTWDEIFSSERDWRYITGLNKPHPVEVIKDTADGSPNADGVRRAQAFSELREPLQNAGNAQDQRAYLDILGAAAKTDRDPICRLCAIRMLGKYKDPRAARILEEVYQMPTKERFKGDRNFIPFMTETTSLIRSEALVGLEQMHDEESRRLLIQVARQPGPPVTADLTDRQQTQDEKIVAIRALRHYKQPECVDTLKYVLRTEKDIALRDRAVQSLEEATGQRYPIEFAAWQRPDVQPLPNGDNIIQQVGGWFKK
jgi:HEAT repeat protein